MITQCQGSAHKKEHDKPELSRWLGDLYSQVDAALGRAHELSERAVDRRCGPADRAAHAAIAVARAAGVEISIGSLPCADRLLARAWQHIAEAEGALT